MQEIKAIISKYDDLKSSNLKLALAIVVNVEQSSYRRSGARMLITEDGQWIGGISGGCLEGDTLKKAKFAIHKGSPIKVTYDTRDGDPNEIGIGLGCNGLIDVLITPIIDEIDNPIETLRKVINRRVPSVLVTDLSTGLNEDYTDRNRENLDSNVQEVLNSGKSRLIDSRFVEFLAPSIALYVFGKNYDVIPLAQIAKSVGWRIYLVTNPLKVNQSLQAKVDGVFDIQKFEYSFDNYSVALLMSHDYKTDLINLRSLQGSMLKYIGLLGPKKRKLKILDELKANGVEVNEENLFGPMGLDTGATTPEEIAISIVSEIRTSFSNRNGYNLRLREGPIND